MTRQPKKTSPWSTGFKLAAGFKFCFSILLVIFATSFKAQAQNAALLDDLYYEYSMDMGIPEVSIDIADPLNRLLSMEESTDLVNWAPLGTFKVTNTNVFVAHTPDFAGHPTVFYRITHDTENQVPNTEANILDLPATPFNYANIVLPTHLNVTAVQSIDNTPVANPITDAGATLGRVLFYDRRFSINNTISCASCHHQDKGFTDGVQFSVGFEGGLTGRNSMSLAMSRFYNRGAFFWDERAPTLEFQSTQPTRDPVEMGSSFPEVANEIAVEPYYQTLFAEAFPASPTPTEANIQLAIAQFIRSMVSYQSKYDQVRGGTATFTAEEELGRQIFVNNPNRGGNAVNCAACHATDVFVQRTPRNNGLDSVTGPGDDQGFGAVSGNAGDIGRFKMASLRNVELTGPYMHDGRFDTLEEVVQFYSTDIQGHVNVDRRLTQGQGNTGPPRTPDYTAAESAALVAFMKTLTDTSFTSDPRWSDPFNYTGSPITPPVPTPNFTATFLTTPALSLEGDVTSITVDGVVATILSYDELSGIVELLFDDSSLAPGSYNAVITHGGGTTVFSTNQFAVPGGPTPTFATSFPTATALPLLSEITSITVGGVVATIASYNQMTGIVELLFDDSSLAPGNYDAVLTFGPGTVVNSNDQHTVAAPPTAENNVLLLIVDDWGIDRSPIDNTIPPAQALPNMPNLEALAADGLQFTRAYANPVCSPFRASLMTGRYAHQTGIYTPGGTLQAAETTLPEAFTAAGSSYAMGAMGKWHLGSGDTGYSTTGGWDEFYGITGGGVGDYSNWTKNSNGDTTGTVTDPILGVVNSGPWTTYTTTDQVNEAVGFIGRSETAGDPWFCWLAFNAPHSPFHDPPAGLAPPGGYSAQVAGESANAFNYRKMLEALDTELGRLLASVPANTNIILIGDNGTPNQVVQAPFGNGNSKGDLYEGGIHVPMVVKGPAVTVPAGSTTDKLVHAVDLYSSILELAGIDPATVAPASTLAQSTSIVPILNGTDTADRAMIAEAGDGAARGRAIIVDEFPGYKLIIFNDPDNPSPTPIQEFYNIGAPANDENEQAPLTIGTLTGTALDAYQACIAADAALGGGFLAP